MTSHRRNFSASALAGIALVAILAPHVSGSASAGPASRGAAMLAAGVDAMPVGTAKQAARAKQARAAKP